MVPIYIKLMLNTSNLPCKLSELFHVKSDGMMQAAFQ